MKRYEFEHISKGDFVVPNGMCKKGNMGRKAVVIAKNAYSKKLKIAFVDDMRTYYYSYETLNVFKQ